MRLDEYQWSRNPRGLHVYSIYQTPMNRERYTRTHMGWIKFIVAGREYVDDAQFFLERNITPCVRLYVAEYGAGPFTPLLASWVDMFVRVGVKWFEFYNEPNLGVEWPNNFNPDWQDRENVIRPLMDNWLVFAEYVIARGGYPGFPSLAESVAPRYAAVPWMDAMLNDLAERHYERFGAVLANGAYCATHPYILNHFYQEVPGGGPTSARPPAAQRAREPGWRFEYPYDPISQRNDPGRTVYGGTALTPYGDPNGLIAMGRMFQERVGAIWGAGNIPVFGTEGGIYPFRGGVFQQDNRYPPYDENSHAEATVAMFDWSAQQAPPWFFGVALWKEDDYYDHDGYVAPAVGALERYAPILKDVPPLPTTAATRTPAPTPTPRGPGPIRGAADFHIVILADGLDDTWFFETARAYYERFRPVVSGRVDVIDLIPYTRSLAVTVIAAQEQIAALRAYFADAYPNMWFDPITATTREEVAAVFDARAESGLRFG